MNCPAQKQLLQKIAPIATEAGRIIQAVRDKGFRTFVKEDASPVTEADFAAHRFITKALQQLTPDIPIVSEEDRGEHGNIDGAPYFWLIDPLDGTKGFARGEKDFAVNIGLMKGNYPLLGAVSLPDYRETYIGGVEVGAWCMGHDGKSTPIAVRQEHEGAVSILLSKGTPYTPQLDKFLAQHRPYEIHKLSSAVKFMVVALGKADFYPRFAPTMEWDTGAPQAVVEGAGGEIVSLDGRRFSYRKPQWRNGGFICRAFP